MKRAVFEWAGLVLLCCLAAPALAQNDCDCQAYSQLIKKEISFRPDGLLRVSNKYGPVELHGWDKSRLRVEARVEVKAASEAYAIPVFERIQIHTEGTTGQAVVVRTEIKDKQQDWWRWGAVELEDYTVSYVIHLPRAASVRVSNKHGDVALNELEGQLTLFLMHGQLNAQGLSGLLVADLSHGKANIRDAGELSLKVKDVKMHLNEARRANIDSRYSTLKLEEVGEVNAQSRYDTYRASEVGFFRNEGKYDLLEISEVGDVDIRSGLSEVFIREPKSRVRLQVDSSEVLVEDIYQHFDFIDLSGEGSNFRLKMEEGAEYQLDAVGSQINYPRALQVRYEQVAGRQHEVKGYHGSKGGRALIRARISNGSFQLD